jgi:hypothetical protein
MSAANHRDPVPGRFAQCQEIAGVAGEDAIAGLGQPSFSAVSDSSSSVRALCSASHSSRYSPERLVALPAGGLGGVGEPIVHYPILAISCRLTCSYMITKNVCIIMPDQWVRFACG